MVLKVLDALGPLHGYGIARRIEYVSEQVLQLNEGTVYTSLLRLQQRKWIASDRGISETIARRSSIRSQKDARYGLTMLRFLFIKLKSVIHLTTSIYRNTVFHPRLKSNLLGRFDGFFSQAIRQPF
jgi:Transcriptional regulator PadR-like family